MKHMQSVLPIPKGTIALHQRYTKVTPTLQLREGIKNMERKFEHMLWSKGHSSIGSRCTLSPFSMVRHPSILTVRSACVEQHTSFQEQIYYRLPHTIGTRNSFRRDATLVRRRVHLQQ